MAPAPLNVHVLLEKLPVPPELKLTVPVGVIVGLSLSVTVAVQVVETPTLTGFGAQPTVVVVLLLGGSATTVVPLLVACVSSPPYEAVMTCPSSAFEVYVTVHEDEDPPPLSVHVDALKVPLLLVVKPTLPVGVVCVPVSTSRTVTVHVVDSPGAIVAGEQLTPVVVRRFVVAVTAAVPELVPCPPSPPYAAVIVATPAALGV